MNAKRNQKPEKSGKAVWLGGKWRVESVDGTTKDMTLEEFSEFLKDRTRRYSTKPMHAEAKQCQT